MQFRVFVRRFLTHGFPFLWVLAGLVNNAPAAGRRDFAGFFRIREISVSGNQVQVNVTVRIGNYSDQALTGARVLIQCPTNAAKNCAVFAGVNIGQNDFFQSTARFTVDAKDLQAWLTSPPVFTLEEVDASGHRRDQRIQMMQAEMGEK
jgi:hypothetical protein